MPSSTSSSETRFFVALATTLCVLVGSWEAVLRQRAGANVDFGFASPPLSATSGRGEEYVIFGNCLMMTGVSPRRVGQELDVDGKRVIVNIAAHEQSPIAFFEYLRKTGHYPDVIVTNVSSWLNGTNFEQEGELVMKADPLGLVKTTTTTASTRETFQGEGSGTTGSTQRLVEDALARWTSSHAKSIGRRYHLFDYLLFVGALATTADLDRALYQLNMQSWYRVNHTETDGNGFLGLAIDYRRDWPTGLDRMADRSLQRLKLSRLLTARYWELLEENVRHFQSHGTQVLFVRMPEHPKIREFNDETYGVLAQLRGIEARTGAPTLDLSELGPADGVHLFDAVHPDAEASEVISHRIGVWLREQRMPRNVAAP